MCVSRGGGRGGEKMSVSRAAQVLWGFTCYPPGARYTSREKFFMTILNPLDS